MMKNDNYISFVIWILFLNIWYINIYEKAIFYSVMWDNTPIKRPTKNIRVADSLRGSSVFFPRNLCNSYREGKNENNLRTKCVEQKLLEIIEVNVPIFFSFWRNLKNEGVRTQKSLFWLWLMKNPFLGPNSLIFEISPK